MGGVKVTALRRDVKVSEKCADFSRMLRLGERLGAVRARLMERHDGFKSCYTGLQADVRWKSCFFHPLMQ